jgi:hypothetical protein
LTSAPNLVLPVGIVVERRKAASPWIDYTWAAVAALAGQPETSPWSELSRDGDTTTFFAGAADIELFTSETGNYRDNLATGEPKLWVLLREGPGEPPYTLAAVTADPAEGEGYTEAGSDLVDAVPMPASVAEAVAGFIAEHHVERVFSKRKRDRAQPEALALRPRGGRGDRHD